MSQQKFSALSCALILALPSAVHASDPRALRGSLSSMRRQHQVAERSNFAFLRTASDVLDFIRRDRLEPLRTSTDVLVADPMFPYARPQVVLFVQRLAEQYHEATGYRLVVTSLTRPISMQPWNAHRLSVHPAGMAVDLHVPATPSAKRWLEITLLGLEARGVIDATREHYPSHFHVAVFPQAYASYVDKIEGTTTIVPTQPDEPVAPQLPIVASLEPNVVSEPAAAPSFTMPAEPMEMIAASLGVVLLLALFGVRSATRVETAAP